MIPQIIIGLAASYSALFLLSLFLKDNSIADIFWGIGFLQVALHAFILSRTVYLTQILLLLCIALWSLRITGYILSKKLKSRIEDRRYREFRDTWKHFYLRSFFQVYLLQGCLLLIIAIPILMIHSSPVTNINAFYIVGVVISLFGLIFESISDMQLHRFLKTRKHKEILITGLWRYSRHPNYFGESVFWLGISLMAVQISVWALIGWAMITVLLRFVSGVPLAEKRYATDTAYLSYKNKTPAMFPNVFIRR